MLGAGRGGCHAVWYSDLLILGGSGVLNVGKKGSRGNVQAGQDVKHAA